MKIQLSEIANDPIIAVQAAEELIDNLKQVFVNVKRRKTS